MPCCGSRTEHFPARQLCDPTHVVQSMRHTWCVTFEVKSLGMLQKPRHPRLTKTFETETEAKLFAKEKIDQGLVVIAGTLNPHMPKQVIPPNAISTWLEDRLDQQAKGSNELGD